MARLDDAGVHRPPRSRDAVALDPNERIVLCRARLDSRRSHHGAMATGHRARRRGSARARVLGTWLHARRSLRPLHARSVRKIPRGRIAARSSPSARSSQTRPSVVDRRRTPQQVCTCVRSVPRARAGGHRPGRRCGQRHASLPHRRSHARRQRRRHALEWRFSPATVIQFPSIRAAWRYQMSR